MTIKPDSHSVTIDQTDHHGHTLRDLDASNLTEKTVTREEGELVELRTTIAIGYEWNFGDIQSRSSIILV